MIAVDFIYMRYLGAFLVLMGATFAGSDMIWIPAALIGCGAIMVLKKRHLPAGKQKKVHSKNYINTISRKGRIAKDENCKSDNKKYCIGNRY